MALTHLLDTSVLTRLGQIAVRDVVEPLAAAGRAARAGTCCCPERGVPFGGVAGVVGAAVEVDPGAAARCGD